MSELHQVVTEGGSPYYSFYHNNVEYVIWLSLVADETDKIDSIKLSKVINSGGVYKPGSQVKGAIATEAYVESKGGIMNVINDVFLPRVNEYLASQDGEAEPFPEGDFKEWLDLVTRFSYSSGRVSLVL